MHHDNDRALSLPRIGDLAPEFSANTSFGNIDFHDWKKGKWAILFSHPADFTPVCSTELVQFAKEKQFFDKRNTLLIGLSIDSIHSHLAWLQNLKSIFDIELPFPMIADTKARVAESYGMIHPNESETVTVRTLFVIDPSNKVRAIIYYPLNVGRNTEEVKRLLHALQTADKHKVACPVNWNEGEKVIIPPPKTVHEVKEAEAASYEKLDFYLCKKSLN
jgi:peroxiredoxin (alkyl hydroperoxide reductase subunit C)